jgi:hypothetical protein
MKILNLLSNEWYVVEQDVCPGNPLDSLKISLDNLNKLADRLGPN